MNLKLNEAGWCSWEAPGKINLMLSVHGRREDGYHALTSLVAPLAFADELELRLNGDEADTLVSDGVAVPLDDSNLVLQAARLFREKTGRSECCDFRLRKRIPVGAGLGGGSSDAVAALKGMDALLDTGLSGDALRTMAACLGSDCPFFVAAAPAVMRGRGEVLAAVDSGVSGRLCGQKVAVFCPSFAIDTGWAYARLAARPELYEEEAVAQARLQALDAGAPAEDWLHNVFEAAVGEKYLAIPCLLEQLRARGHRCMMSGSGSACFALVGSAEEAAAVRALCLRSWGEGIFWVETSFAARKM